MKFDYGSRPGLADVNVRVAKNDATIANTLMRTRDLKGLNQCRGIHGAMRERRRTKKATSLARRRHDKNIIVHALEENI